MHFLKHFKNVKFKIENKGEELLITGKGTKETIAKLEKKLNAMKELCGDDCCGGEKEGCCGDHKGGCC